MTIVGASGTELETNAVVPVYWSSPTASSPSRLNLIEGITRGLAAGINNQGTIVGVVSSAADNSSQSVYWASTASNPNILSKLNGATEGEALGINDQGTIVGYNTLGDDDVPVYWSSITASSPNTLPLLNDAKAGQAFDINNQGTIVGLNVEDTVDSNTVPVYWSSIAATAPSQLLGLDGATEGSANGINNQGNIVGYNNVGNVSVPLYWSSVTSTPSRLLLLPGGGGGYARDINNQGNIVGAILIGNDLVPVYWSSAASPPIRMSLLQGDTAGGGLGINDEQTAISNICFPAGTPINTDQGIIAIEKIDSHKHTLNHQPIQHITQTTTLDPYLICFEKDAVRRNIPNKRTIMTKDHLVAFEGQLVPAYRFLKYSKQVKKVDYHGEMLYNVLLAEHSLMTVNNLECETLHPDNSIAKLYNAGFTAEETNTLIIEMNEALRQKNFAQYKNAVNRINQ